MSWLFSEFAGVAEETGRGDRREHKISAPLRQASERGYQKVFSLLLQGSISTLKK